MKSLYKKICLLTLSVGLCAYINAQQTFVNIDWVASNGNPDNYDYVSSAIDPNGNLVYISNHHNGSNTDILLTALASNGTVLWQNSCGSSPTADDYGTDLKIDNSGNIFICASKHNGSNLDYLVAKYSSTGSLIWQQAYNGTGNGDDVPSAITLDASGNVFVTGTSKGTGPPFNTDYATIKFNSSGTQQWVKRYNFTNLPEIATGIGIDNSGNVIVCGTSANNALNADFTIVKYNNASGAQMGVQRHATAGNGYDLPTEMKIDGNGKIFVVGTSEAGTNKDIKVLALNNNLTVNWIKYIDKCGNTDEGHGLALKGNSEVVATGFSTKTSGGTDFITCNYSNTSGVENWTNSKTAVVDSDISKGRKVTIGSNGTIYVTGEVQKGVNRVFSIIAFRPDGSIKWGKDIDGLNSSDYSPRQILEDNGIIYITGIENNGSTNNVTTVKLSEFEKDQPVVYCNSKPCYVDDEVLIRFNPSDLILSNVDNKRITWGIVADFVNHTAISAINEKIGFDIARQRCYKVHPNLTSVDSVSISRFGNTVKLPPFHATFGVILPQGSDDSLVVQNLNTAVPHVIVSTLNAYAELFLGANDPHYNNGNSAGLHPSTSIPDANINIEPAWDYETGDSSVIVGVYDSGINYAHLDMSQGTFSSSSVKDGYDYFNSAPINATANPDNQGHGSAVAGIIAAWRNNSFGIAGVAGGPVGFEGVSVNDMKIFHATTGCSVPAVPLNVIQQAIIEGSTNIVMPRQDIQNHSWGGVPANDPLIREAFNTAYANEIVICIASGNMGSSACNVVSYPATYRDHMVMKVGANDSTGARASFSECGWRLDFIAPGTHDLYIGMGINGSNFSDSLVWNGGSCVGILDGTSFASPHAAGVAALMVGYYKKNVAPTYNELSHEDCEQLMERNTTDLVAPPNSPGYDDETGWGRLNAGAIFDSINYPKFLVKHYDFSVNTSTATLAGFHEETRLEQSIAGLPTGITKVNRWQVTGTNSHALPSGYNLIDGWARGSGGTNTTGVTSTVAPLTGGFTFPLYFLPSEVDAELNSFSASSSTMTGYIYELLDNSFNHVGWWPVDTSAIATFAYSLYLVNPTVSVEELSEPTFNMFPNPTDNSVTIQLGNINDKSDIIITNISGQVVRVISGTSDSNIIIPVNDFADGMYFVTVSNPKVTITKKLIVKH